MIETSETKMQNPENLPIKPDGCVRTIPLDGQNGGSPFYAPFNVWDSATVLARKLDMANAEISRLRTELEQYSRSGRVLNTSYEITPRASKSGIDVYEIKMNPESDEISSGFAFFKRICRALLAKRMGKEFLNDLTVFLAQKCFQVSREEVLAKLARTGDAVDSVTTGVRSIRDLIKAAEARLRPDSSVDYVPFLETLADSMNIKAYEKFYILFSGEDLTDARVYRELKVNREFADTLSQFQLDFYFAVRMFLDYPQLLEKPAKYLTDFMSALLKQDNIISTLQNFRAGLVIHETVQRSEEKNEAPLSDPACDVLEFCLENGSSNGVSAKAMREHIKDDSKSHFSKTILVPLRNHGFLEATCEDPHSSNQRYRITPDGVTALRRARPGRTYPEPIRTDPGTVPGVPGGKTE